MPNWSTPAEILEILEPWKCNHVRLRAAMFYTRRGLGSREFMNKLPQISPAQGSEIYLADNLDVVLIL